MRYFYIFIRPMAPWTATAALTSSWPMVWDLVPSAPSVNTGVDLLWLSVPRYTMAHRSRYFAR